MRTYYKKIMYACLCCNVSWDTKEGAENCYQMCVENVSVEEFEGCAFCLARNECFSYNEFLNRKE